MKFDGRFGGIFGFLLMAVLVSGCVVPNESGYFNVSVSTDRYVYHSGETMNLNATIVCSGVPKNITIKIQGIKDRRGRYRILEVRDVELVSVDSIQEFSFTVPRCYGCAGVSPGEYEVEIMVLQNETDIWNGSVSVYLEK